MEKKRLDIICMGMALVDSIIKGFDPEPVSASGFCAQSGSLNVGGEAVNEAVSAARLGMKTGIVCALGEDGAADMILSQLQKDGVDTVGVLRSADHPTPVTTMFVNSDGTRKSITNASHKYNFHPELHVPAFTCSRALILGSLFRAPFNDPKIIYSVVSEAKKAGQIVVADTKLPNFVKLSLADIADSLPFVDFITPNEDEAKYYSGKTDPEDMADVFLSYGVKNVVIKLGAKGCFFKNAKTSFFLPAFPIEAADATGAGDCFVAGLTCEVLRILSEEAGEESFGRGTGAGAELPSEDATISLDILESRYRDILLFATACGAICTTKIGAITALRDRAQVIEFLSNL